MTAAAVRRRVAARLACRAAGLRLVAALALTLLAPAAMAAALGETAARQLLTRTGFAPTPLQVAQFAPLSQAQAVDRLLAGVQRQPRTPAPAWIDERLVLPRELQQMSEAEQRAYRQTLVRHSLELRGWWLREMADTPSPLTERMTLFWHNHFVSAQPKVRWPQPLYRQNLLLREHALGSFAELLHAILRDPALLIYLDGAANRRGQPNENLARELMELFTLGQGHYTEADIKDAARALTGHSIDPSTGGFLYRPGLHDRGRKTVLGETGALDGDDLLRVLLRQPAGAVFIVDKLWREFVSPVPDAQRVAPIAEAFRASGHAIPVALRALLLQPEVVSTDPAHALVKSPVELVVGLLRQSGASLREPAGAAIAAAAMGQNLFGAPNVRGWPGGEAWINTQTLLVRKQFIDRLLTAPAAAQPTMQPAADAVGDPQQRMQRLAAQAMRVDPQAWLAALAGVHPERPLTADELATLAAALGTVPPASPPAAGTLALDALRALLLDPSYQLK
jgi:uncharacterized protein (DUF1800 family)